MAQTRLPARRPLASPTLASQLPAIALPRPPGLFRELGELDAFFSQVYEKAFILSPVVSLDHIPEFYEISLRYVRVDPRVEMGEVYSPDRSRDSEVALTKSALDKIAGAAGISWDPIQSRRLDDGSDRHYCHFRAVGVFRDIDGSTRTLVGEKEIDAREGNLSIFDPEHLHEGRTCNRGWCTFYADSGKWRGDEGFKRGWTQARLDGVREHILAMCESKARNRAIRSLGVKQKYRVQDLVRKPFVVPKIVLTGRSQDPELERMAKVRLLERATQDLFGQTPAAPRERVIHQVESPEPVHTPPPIEQAQEPEQEEPVEVDSMERCACPDAAMGIHELTCPVPHGAD